MQLELILPLAGTVLAAVTAGIAKVWQLFQQGRADCLERCAALTLDLRATERERDESRQEVKSLQLEVRDLLISSSALRAKNDRLSGRDSDRL